MGLLSNTSGVHCGQPEPHSLLPSLGGYYHLSHEIKNPLGFLPSWLFFKYTWIFTLSPRIAAPFMESYSSSGQVVLTGCQPRCSTFWGTGGQVTQAAPTTLFLATLTV